MTDSPLTLAIAHLRYGVYTCAAAGTVLLYDILLTSEDEIRLIWPSRFSLAKFLYFMNRYFPVPCLILGMYHLANLRGPLSTDFCKLVTLSQMAGQAICLVTATWLLVLRIVALFSGNKLVAAVLYTVFIGTHVATIVLSSIIIHQIWGGLVYIDFIGMCVGSPLRTLGLVYFIPVLCEVVLVVMQLLHAYLHTRRLTNLRPTTPLLLTLYADGFLYFILVMTMRLWSAFMFMFADPTYWYLSTYIEFALISVSVSRLVLHLRRTAEVRRESNADLSTSIPLSQLTKPATGTSRCNWHCGRGWRTRRIGHHRRHRHHHDHDDDDYDDDERAEEEDGGSSLHGPETSYAYLTAQSVPPTATGTAIEVGVELEMGRRSRLTSVPGGQEGQVCDGDDDVEGGSRRTKEKACGEEEKEGEEGKYEDLGDRFSAGFFPVGLASLIEGEGENTPSTGPITQWTADTRTSQHGGVG